MKTKTKSLILALLFLIVISIGLNVSAVEARYIRDFNGVADSLWARVTDKNTKNMKDNTRTYAVVNWDYSSQKGAHNMWFRVVNSNNEDRGTTLVPYLERKEFSTSATHTHYYWLLARRENGVDPETRVKGTWTP